MRMKRTFVFLMGLAAVFLAAASGNACVIEGGTEIEIESGDVPHNACFHDYSRDYNSFLSNSWQNAEVGRQQGAGLGDPRYIPQTMLSGGVFGSLFALLQNGGEINPDEMSFWYCDSISIDLINLLASLSNLNLMYEIQDSGQIVGTITIFFKTYSFVIRPMCDDIPQVPVPGALLLLGSSIGVLALLKRRKA